MEQQFSGMFEQMFTHLAGNPHLPAEEIESRSWSDTLADNAWNHVVNADYSLESFDNALTHIGDNASVLGQLAAENAQGTASPFAWNTGVAERAAEIRAGRSGGGD